jgi:hypothetical protein
MNVIVTQQHGCIYLCDFRNDHDAISDILQRSPLKPIIDALDAKFVDDLSDESWNAKLRLIIQALETAGCTILWD